MSIKKLWLILLILIVLVAGVYLYPTPEKSFDELYAKVDAETVDSLKTFQAGASRPDPGTARC